jgi:hypothetical protein
MMELIDVSVLPRNLLRGIGTFEATAGKTVKIETSPQGLSILNVQVPDGELWQVNINIQIEKLAVV